MVRKKKRMIVTYQERWAKSARMRTMLRVPDMISKHAKASVALMKL